jgi:hypothetical protein
MKSCLLGHILDNGALQIYQVVYIFIVYKLAHSPKQKNLFSCDEAIAPNQALKLTGWA